MTLVKESVVMSFDYAKTLPVYEWEEYVKVFQKFNSLFQNWRTKHVKVPTTFVDPIRPQDVKFKKGKHCGLSLYKVLEEEKAEKRQWRQIKSIKQAQLEQHNVLFPSLINVENPDPSSSQVPNLSVQDLLDGPEFNSDKPKYKSEYNGSNNNVQYQKTQAKSHSAISPLAFSSRQSCHRFRHLALSFEINNSNLNELIDIDKLLSQQIPPPLVLLSQNLTISQLCPFIAPIVTCTARAVTPKKIFEL